MMAAHSEEQPRARRSRLRLVEAAIELFAREGYERATVQRIAEVAGTSVGLAFRYFPSKEHFVLALYDRIASQLEEWVVEMPEGTVAERFRATLEKKLELVVAHEGVLLALAGKAIDPAARANVFGAATEVVRSRVAGVFWLAVLGATDAPTRDEAARLARMLYGAHLLLVLLALQGNRKATRDSIDIACAAVAARELGGLGGLLLARLDAVFGETLGTSRSLEPSATARLVLQRIFRRRRVLPGVPLDPGEAALALHLVRVQSFIDAGEPIQLVLPAFPAKAPNPRKVLGKHPDGAESLALESLRELLDEIAEAYAPGADLTICSDGHVFADVVGVSDADVRTYRQGIEAMIDDLETKRIRVFGLEDAFGTMPPKRAREQLLATHGEAVEAIQARAKTSQALGTQLDGIHRLLFEDEMVRSPSASRTQARKLTRERAYEVVRRSDAWGQLVTTVFPRAVRLSIHPQPEVSSKIGISLLSTDDAWLTPWHGVALFEGDRARLVHRSVAEEAGASVVHEGGKPFSMALP